MKRVITYGTYDLLHEGHLNLLRRAKELGDYLIVGVTTDNFDIERGKLSAHYNVMRRIEQIRETGLADEIIIEEYVGQKIDDIQKYNIDVFAIGSDWTGKFDYLSEYCDVVYLERTKGISSTQLRSKQQLNIGIIGAGRISERFITEALCVNGVKINCVYDLSFEISTKFAEQHAVKQVMTIEEMLPFVDAVYIASPPLSHYDYASYFLLNGKHVLCETPMTLSVEETRELYALAEERKLTLMEANKTAFTPAFNHLVSLIKSGIIGKVVDIDASMSTLRQKGLRERDERQAGGSVTENISFALLPILRLFGTDFKTVSFFSFMEGEVDIYTKGVLLYDQGVASFKVGLGVKTEGNLVISGTEGYLYVPAPWWKTDYFEARYEDINRNRKYFYMFAGEGLRYEIQEFHSCIKNNLSNSGKLPKEEVIKTSEVIHLFRNKNNLTVINQ